jgi:hypothetical protein
MTDPKKLGVLAIIARITASGQAHPSRVVLRPYSLG